MVKNSSSIESLENKIFQITIANLANNDKLVVENDIIEFNDVEMSLELFKNCFYDNNYRFFEINNQFSQLEELKIHNKTIKSANFKNYKNGTKIDLIDVMTYKYIKNKKTKINDTAKLFLIKDISIHNSLLDFKIYNTHLNFDNILDIYKQNKNIKNKEYFRFKIKANYYSSDLDENICFYFNYLVKIPKKNNKNKEYTDVNIVSNIDKKNIIHEETTHDNSIFDESTVDNDLFDESTVDNDSFNKSIVDNDSFNKKSILNNDSFNESTVDNDSLNKSIMEFNKINEITNIHENIIYSNYAKKACDENISLDLFKDIIIESNKLGENLSDLDDDDNYDDSCDDESIATSSSSDINYSESSFF